MPGAELGNGEHVATGGVFEGFGIEMKDESPSARPGLTSPLAQSLVELVRERTGREPSGQAWLDGCGAILDAGHSRSESRRGQSVAGTQARRAAAGIGFAVDDQSA